MASGEVVTKVAFTRSDALLPIRSPLMSESHRRRRRRRRVLNVAYKCRQGFLDAVVGGQLPWSGVRAA